MAKIIVGHDVIVRSQNWQWIVGNDTILCPDRSMGKPAAAIVKWVARPGITYRQLTVSAIDNHIENVK